MNDADLSDAEINRQFMPRLAVPDHESWLAAHAELSETARRTLPCHLDIPYGETPLQKLDIFPAARAPAPVQVYFHGGYWRALDKSTYRFMALSMAPAGIATVLVNYDLCPAVTLDDIVGQTIAAVAWVYRHGADHGCDPRRLYVSGNSAGAHLAAMALAQDWRAQGLPADLIKGACCITGIYDLAPVLRIDANAEIRLTARHGRPQQPAHAAAAGEAARDRRRRRRRDAALDQAVDRLRRHAARAAASRPS